MSRRRKRNKKKQAEGVMFPPRLAAVLVLAALCSLSYLWLCERCDALGRSIKELESDHLELRRRSMNEEYKWSNMKSPRNIERLLRRHGLSMTWPDERHVVRIRLGAPSENEEAGLVDARRYAQRTGTMMND